MKNPEHCEGKAISLYKWEGSSENLVYVFNFQVGRKYCYPKKGRYMLKLGNVLTKNFSLSGLHLRLDAVHFQNDSEVQVKFEKLPPWVSRLKLEMEKSGNIVGSVTVERTPALIPGNYTINNSYNLWYFPEVDVPEAVECGKIEEWLFGEEHYYSHKPTKTPLDVNNTAMKLIVFLGVCCLCIGIVAVVIFFRYARAVDNPSSLLPCYHSTTGTRNNSVSSTSPLIVTTLTTDKCKISPSVEDVLLVHAADTPELVHFCQKLKAAIAKCCNRKVLDITIRNVKRMESPETWLLQVLTQQDTIVLLVMSPGLAALHRSLQPNGEGNKVAVNGRMQAWDNLLRECLRYLQDHLALNYTRLFIVARSQESLTKDNIPQLVPGKRYLLPLHHQELLRALGSCQV
ncbi:uncharacterized protein LOC123512092 isoform X2 [Portunus trituberculatus]|uniref:uncharacterized protein LOC123512092 isoform X2 n=1 Tax=Portunus trituberculatus TaxID=210409 RepID=UPI001E1CD686|nr:uncharacterized protein LOC123512092 isoform X2 [Portunus trituberculatus]